MSKSARRLQSKSKRSGSAPSRRPKEPLQSERQEKMSQFTLKMRESLHRELARMAFDSDMTMRGFIMSALQNKGLNVTKKDLVDRRRR